MKNFLFPLILVFLISTFCFGQTIDKRLSLNAEDLSELTIECGAGFLKVEGFENTDKIEVDAEIFVEGFSGSDLDEYLESQMELTLEKRGSRAILVSRIDGVGGFFKALTSGSRHSYVNLSVKVPSRMRLDINDGSGFMEVKHISDRVEITDGSGELTVYKIGGDLEIDDGSGSVVVEDVDGKVDIDDGSGELEVLNVKGSVEIDDGSGSLTVSDIKGDISVDDGSGDLRLTNIDGSVRVSDGSGSIYITNVGQDVTIREAGSGSVQIVNVNGKVYRDDD